LVDAKLTVDVTLSRCEGFLKNDKCSEKQKKIRQSTKIDCRKIVVWAWGFEPQRIAAQEPKGDVTTVNVFHRTGAAVVSRGRYNRSGYTQRHTHSE
jgi:hypothetical protein